MKIEGTNSALTNLKHAPKVSSGGQTQGGEASKSIGETPPKIVDLGSLGSLAALFGRGGTFSKLKRRLNKLKGKKCKVVPAIGTIACVDDNDLVYLGVKFLEEFQNDEDLIAGVMAHEWGHSCAMKPTKEEMSQLNWDQIFELRKAHETLADELSGRLLALMGFEPDKLIEFLMRDKNRTHNLKYHDPETRAEIIKHGHRDELRKKELSNELFPAGAYRNNYHSTLIDDDI